MKKNYVIKSIIYDEKQREYISYFKDITCFGAANGMGSMSDAKKMSKREAIKIRITRFNNSKNTSIEPID